MKLSEYRKVLSERNKRQNKEKQKYHISDVQWVEAVQNSKSKKEVLTKLGINNSKGVYHSLIVEAIQRLNLDISHFSRPTHQRTLDDILVVNSSFTHTGHLKDKLVRAGLKKLKCDDCGLEKWNGKSLHFDLHHVNGVWTDNRLDNLQLLCPNCHSQTPNFGHKNKGSGRPR